MSWNAGVIAVAFVVGVVLILACIASSKSWERFKERRHCQLTGKHYVCDSGEYTK